jgi:hypothetical protein
MSKNKIGKIKLLPTYDITLEIEGAGEGEYPLTYRDPDPEQEAKLKAEVAKYDDIGKAKEIDDEIFELNRRLRLNDELLIGTDGSEENLTSNVTGNERKQILLENKELFALVSQKKAERKALNIKAKDVMDQRENVMKLRFELLIGGEGKAGIEDLIRKYGLKYSELMQHIHARVLEEQKKK